MRRAAKVDANQAEVIKALRDCGAAVTPLHQVGQGVPDILVSYGGVWYLMELKTKKGSVNEIQNEWMLKQKAPTYVVRTPAEACEIIGVAGVEEGAGQVGANRRTRPASADGGVAG